MKVDISDDDAIQAQFTAGLMLFNILGLTVLNRIPKRPKHSTVTERCSHYIALTLLLAGELLLDSWYPNISMVTMAMKGLCAQYSIGLLDFYFSNIKTMDVIDSCIGVGTWAVVQAVAAVYIEDTFGRNLFDNQPWSQLSAAKCLLLYGQFVLLLFVTSVTADLIFCPAHRFMHRYQYALNHKEHHIYTTNLCGLVFYSGTVIDDIVMAFAVSCFGLPVYLHLLSFFSVSFSSLISTPVLYTAYHIAVYAHSHNTSLATLLIPFLPNSLNFIAYHNLHHLDPACNMGLTEVGDRVWDLLLREKTIRPTCRS
eukprot:TRINITY_DN15727_c0_g1_i1.p1 TRINITY_DN15727_c0_g1~~TRINITY_DN15727_c0_g1_i1.p1  ORF type:complete len:311 (+),score=41.62 TRINITY_DN15727_c0_g1_i1:65-997(+)